MPRPKKWGPGGRRIKTPAALEKAARENAMLWVRRGSSYARAEHALWVRNYSHIVVMGLLRGSWGSISYAKPTLDWVRWNMLRKRRRPEMPF
ncbi:MAG: hypothetical protein AB7T31_18290 [Gemmatimonadales bacterium]